MQLPGPLRATVGLVATAADEARRLPQRALELPMLAISTALQASVRAQQHYARLAARGDAVLNRTQSSEQPPAWATFDEPLSEEELRHAPSRFDVVDSLSADSAAQTAPLVGELIDPDEPREQAPGVPNGALPDASTGNPAYERPLGVPAATTQPRQPPPRRAAPARSAETSTAQSSTGSTPDSESADS